MSMLEVIITLSIMSIVSVASVWLVFTTLALRDLTLATTSTSESLRVFSSTLARAVRNAAGVSSSPSSLFLTSADECWSFVFDESAKVLRYNQTTSVGCTPDPSPSESFFSSYSQISNFTFSVSALPTGGRQITAIGTVTTILPFENYQTSFLETFTNVID